MPRARPDARVAERASEPWSPAAGGELEEAAGEVGGELEQDGNGAREW